MAERRRYTRKDKVTAILAAEASSVAAAAEEQGIPESTVRYWVDSPKFAELRAKNAQERADGYRLLSLMAQMRLMELLPTMEPQHLITLMGVAEDKAQILSGGVTNRTETMNLTPEVGDHERVALRGALDDFFKRQAESKEAEKLSTPEPAT